MLLLTLAPVVAAYTFWSVQWSQQNYIADLKREIRANARALAPVLARYAGQGRWTEVDELFHRMSANGTEAALLKDNGGLWHASANFPRALVPTAIQGGINTKGFEFERKVANRHWFCRIVPLSDGRPIGYMLVAQDWTNISENLRQRVLPPVGAALIVAALIAVLIPILIGRYVSRPLAELSRKVTRFSGGEELADSGGGDAVKLISEEFERLDQQLTKAHAELLERHRHELELHRRLQRADRLATIGTLASGLAHEIGTPMSVIRTRAELLLQGNPAVEKVRESLEIILGQIQRTSKIVRMLLDYARARESNRGRYDVKSIIGDALKLVETEAKRGGVRINAELGDRPLMVECDPDQLQQVFVNLVINALDAMAPDGGTLEVSTTIAEKDDRTDLKVIFEDSGPGVPKEFQQQLFDPFFTTKPPGKGTGMGLAVSQSIMRDHNGDITYENAAAGARFSVIIPMTAADIGPGARARIVPGTQS